MAMKRLSVLVLLFSLAATPLRAQEYVDESKLFVQDLADRTIAVATANLPDDQVQGEIRDLLYHGFAVKGIARFVLGRYWRRASEDERVEYMQLFEEVVINTSASRLRRYSGESFEITTAIAASSANNREQAAIVRSRFHLSEDSAVRVDWRVANLGDTYKITDVILEGVSLANTYRDEFTAVVRRQGMSGLLAELRQRRDELAVVSSEAITVQ